MAITDVIVLVVSSVSFRFVEYPQNVMSQPAPSSKLRRLRQSRRAV